ncbi:MAG: hypothetical protein KBD25_06130 [Rickettsiaceae bacterium]|nr:hypothetical protein [Rickettsiaceae bacterium]
MNEPMKLHNTENRQELINHYEALRSSVLESNESSSTGFSIFILRGMTSWIKTNLLLEPINSPVVNLEVSKQVRPLCTLQQIQKEMTTILTNMILLNQPNKEGEYNHV